MVRGTEYRLSTKPFLQSSELGLPHSLNRRRVSPPPLVPKVGHTRLRERGWSVLVPTRGHRLWYFVVKGIKGKEQQNRNLRGKGTFGDKGY
jgi:hypothetical protein